MRTLLQMLIVVAAVSSAAYAQTAQTPYAGQEKREIKALSPDEIQAYQNGQGMGFAKAAATIREAANIKIISTNIENGCSEYRLQAGFCSRAKNYPTKVGTLNTRHSKRPVLDII